MTPTKHRSSAAPARQGLLELDYGAWVRHEPAWLSAPEGEALFEALVRELPWQQKSIRLFGKWVVQPRLVAWAGELPYRYSGQTLEPRARPACLDAIWQRVERRTRVEFNHVLINRYRDGQDHMGWHADDEPELGIEPVIGSLSLGAPRHFLIKRKRSAARAAPDGRWLLEHGSLLVMGGSTQHHYRHRVPQERHVRSERINLTFRKLLRSPTQTETHTAVSR